MKNNLTRDKPFPALFKYIIPMFISVIFQQIYTITDSAIIGKYAGEEALAAIGASYPINMVFMAVATGSSIGCTVAMSQYFGGKQYGKLKTSVYTALIFGVTISVVLALSGILFSSQMLNMVSTPSDIFQQAKSYMTIYFCGFIFIYIYTMTNGIFIALSDSRTPLIMLVFSSLFNVLLAYIFVAKLGYGVKGAAWALFIAQGTACIISMVILLRRTFRIKAKASEVRLWSVPILLVILGIAMPSIMQQSFVSVGNFFLQNLINSQGKSVIAGYSVAVKLNAFTLTSITAISSGISAFTAQNIGAGKLNRVKSGFNVGLLIMVIIATPFFIAYYFFPEACSSIFMKSESVEAMEVSVDFLKTVAPFYFVVGLKIVTDGILRGSKTLVLFMVTTFADLVFRVIMAHVFFELLGLRSVWLSWPLGWGLACLLSIIFYYGGFWKKKYKKIKV